MTCAPSDLPERAHLICFAPMTERQLSEPQSLQQLPVRILDEVIRQFRATRNDVLRYAVWNLRNVSDEEFNHIDDDRLFGYFRQDLLETRFLSKGRRVDLVQLWNWFDDQLSGNLPLLIGDSEVFVNIQDKDLDKCRKRIEEIAAFLPILRSNDLEGFKRVKYKLRRTVMRLTYDLHHLSKRLEKYRKGPVGAPVVRAVESHHDPEVPAAIHDGEIEHHDVEADA
jgi:hypothetical protein